MSEALDIRSMSVTGAAKLLKVAPKTIRAHIRRGLPLVDGRIDLIVYGAWLNQRVQASDLRLQERPESPPLKPEVVLVCRLTPDKLSRNELVQLLNSTALGECVTRGRLNSQMNRSGWRWHGGRHIRLLDYLRRLVRKTDQPAKVTNCRRRESNPHQG